MDHTILIGLPGEEMIRQGLEDYGQGRKTLYSVMIQIAKPRLSETGLLDSTNEEYTPGDEVDLYRLLQKEKDAFTRYRSLLKDLTSFENALDHRIRRIRGVRGVSS